jgi:crotonobetainyl-CoA:carnitine CoA-transferase CaiB-like acyl-CoA transferase
MPPFAEKEGNRKAAGFMSYNRNKKSLALNLQHLEGQKIFHDLATTADVVVENLRPGAMDKIGLNYSNLSSSHTRLIWAIISGFGQLKGYRGPYSDRPAFDIVAEAMSGIMHQVGYADKPPSDTLYGMADIYTGMVTAFGIMQALFMRERTGKGQLIDSAMFDNMLSLNESMVALHSVAGQSPMRGTPKNLFPRGAFKTKDGYIALNVPDNIIWERLCKAINRIDMIEDPRCKTGVERAANAHYIQPIIEVWLEQLTRDDAVEKLNSSGVPTGPVNTAEDIFSDPHVNARGLLMPITDSEVGKHLFARSPPFLSEAPTLPTKSAPKLGEHTIEILTEVLGYSGEKINELSEGGVIGH